MKAALPKGLFGALLLAMALAFPAAAQARLAPTTDRIIVKWKDSQRSAAALTTENRRRVLEASGGAPLQSLRRLSAQTEVMRLPEKVALSRVEALARSLAADPAVAYAEPDYRRLPALDPNDSYYSEQWSVQAGAANPGAANLPDAWKLSTGDNSVVVAVLDTGIVDHEDLPVASQLPGYDFVSADGLGNYFTANDGDGWDSDPSDPGDWISAEEANGTCAEMDSTWHGTHVAGTIGAAGDNALGIAGVSWNSALLPVRALGKCGGYVSDIAAAIAWAAGLPVTDAGGNILVNPNPAQVLNLSVGGQGACSNTEQEAIDAVIAAGAVVVVAAGNESMNAVYSAPANCEGVIVVAAHSRQGGRSWYSNYGSSVDISAPGGDHYVDTQILSTVDSGATVPQGSAYAAYQGTSMATPHVTGVVALMQSKHKATTGNLLTPRQVERALAASAAPFPSGTGRDCSTALCGAGMLDAAAAVAAVDGDVAPVADVGPDQTVDATQTQSVTLDGSGSEDDGSIVSYLWEQIGGTSVTLANAATATASFDSPDVVDALLFRLTVSDDAGLSDSDTVTVHLNNYPPVLQSVVATTFSAGVTDTISLSASDPDGTTPSLSVSNPPPDSTFKDHGDGTATFSWTPAAASAGSSYEFTFSATDGVATDSQTLNVRVVNYAPLWFTLGEVQGYAGEALQFTVRASDADGTTPLLSVANPPAGSTFDDNDNGTGTFSWGSPQPGSYSIEFTAVDAVDSSLTASQTVLLSVVESPQTSVGSSGGGGGWGVLGLLMLLPWLRGGVKKTTPGNRHQP